jgi:GDP-4-dehydro-6-deoxy-D-mannose reductase
MRVLVTGVSGFVGPVVARALVAAGHVVHGVARHPPDAGRLAGAPVAFHARDIREPGALGAVVRDVRPDAVVHLAAVAEPAAAEGDPTVAYAVNLGGSLALLAAVRTHAPRARVLVVSTSTVYGAVDPDACPLGEDTPMRPLTVYAASKAAAELAALQWQRAYALDVVVARPFNHTGPGQRTAYLCPALAAQVASIEAGRQPAVLAVGNLDPVRDVLDVRDVAAGYLALLAHGRAGTVYNLCSGTGVRVGEIVAVLRGLSRVPLDVRVDPGRRRSHDVPRVVGSRALVTAHTGWTPVIPLRDTLVGLLDECRHALAAPPPPGYRPR